MKTDAQLKKDVEAELEWEPAVDAAHIGVAVKDGVVTLTGEVNWDYQRRVAEQTVHPITGVRGVTNSLTLKTTSTPSNITERIEHALSRQAEREAKTIEVTVNGTTATLRGQVHSWAERNAAQGAAFSAPGITTVLNDLRVGN